MSVCFVWLLLEINIIVFHFLGQLNWVADVYDMCDKKNSVFNKAFLLSKFTSVGRNLGIQM